ncbi:hypothetical protein D3C80_607090 [compost metagenome]
MLFGGLVFALFDGVLEVFVDEARRDGGGLDADDLALQKRLQLLDGLACAFFIAGERIKRILQRHVGKVAVLQHGESLAGAAVGHREVDDFLTLFGGGHAGHDGVELAGVERGDHSVESLGNDRALDLHVIAEIVRHLDIVTVQRAIRAGEVIGRKCAFGGDGDFRLFLRESAGRKRHRCEYAGSQCFDDCHCRSPSPCWV